MGLDGEGTDGGAEAGHSPIDARIDAHRKSDAKALSPGRTLHECTTRPA